MVSVFHKVVELDIPGAFRLLPRVHEDFRGQFVKTMHAGSFHELGLVGDFREEFFSVSHKNVVRGVHFQIPPCDHAKLVYCIFGSVVDVLVDLRRSSSTYRKVIALELNGIDDGIIYIPQGVGHGFCSLKDDSVMIYKTSVEYAPDCDKGVLWCSLDYKWPVSDPIVSDRDKSFPSICDYDSPF